LHHQDLPSFPTRRSSDLVNCSVFSERTALGKYSLCHLGGEVATTFPIFGNRVEIFSYCVGKSCQSCALVRITLLAKIMSQQIARSEEHTSELQSRSDLVC